jgi:hypothetical protein
MNYYNKFGKIVSVDIKNFDQNWIPGKCEDCINPINTELWKNYVTFYQGSTTDLNIVSKIREHAKNSGKYFLIYRFFRFIYACSLFVGCIT